MKLNESMLDHDAVLQARLECLRLAVEKGKATGVAHFCVENEAATYWRFLLEGSGTVFGATSTLKAV